MCMTESLFVFFKGTYSMSIQKIPMTAGGHQRLEDEIRQLTSVERPAIIEAIAEARSHGDLSENA